MPGEVLPPISDEELLPFPDVGLARVNRIRRSKRFLGLDFRPITFRSVIWIKAVLLFKLYNIYVRFPPTPLNKPTKTNPKTKGVGQHKHQGRQHHNLSPTPLILY